MTLFVFTVVSLLCGIVFAVVSSLCGIVFVYCCFLALWHCLCPLLFTVVLHFSRQVFLDLIEEVDAIIDKSVC